MYRDSWDDTFVSVHVQASRTPYGELVTLPLPEFVKGIYYSLDRSEVRILYAQAELGDALIYLAVLEHKAATGKLSINEELANELARTLVCLPETPRVPTGTPLLRRFGQRRRGMRRAPGSA